MKHYIPKALSLAEHTAKREALIALQGNYDRWYETAKSYVFGWENKNVK